MGFAVKITTFSKLLDLFCPCICRGCGRQGSLLCDCCKNYNISPVGNFCPNCFEKVQRICPDCDLPFNGLFVCGWRHQLLGQLVEEFKFDSIQGFSEILAGIMDEKLPPLIGEIVIIPLPTIAKHIRERGFDHTLLLANELARIRGWQVESVLERAQATVQVGTDRSLRWQQASQAYKIKESAQPSPGKTYLLLDDIWTTGASMISAAELLQKWGASNIMGVVLAANGYRGDI